MTESEGIVAAIDEQGRAHVVLRVGERGPPCPSHPEGCLCSGGRPGITVKAINTSDASVGDLVSVTFKPGAIMKSLTILLGIPSLGLFLGAVVGLILNRKFGFQSSVAYFIAAVGLSAGIVLSIGTYRRIWADIQPFISHIIRTGFTAPVLSRTIDPVCKKEMDSLRASARLEFRGRMYYFCQPDCLKAFIKDPGRYNAGPLF